LGGENQIQRAPGAEKRRWGFDTGGGDLVWDNLREKRGNKGVRENNSRLFAPILGRRREEAKLFSVERKTFAGQKKGPTSKKAGEGGRGCKD